MSIVFLSHASADESLIDSLKTMLQSGSGSVLPKSFTHLSTGIPAGSNFIDYIRDKMQDASFVVAVITPAYLESEFCLAELGAVWALADKDFFPLCVPSVDRSELKATLAGIQVERIEESDSLAELLQRIADRFGRDYNAAACTKAVRVFLATLEAHVAALQGFTKVPAQKLDEANETTEAVAEQLALAQMELEKERRRYEELKVAKTPEEIDALDLPEDEVELVKQLLQEARSAILPLSSTVREVMPFRMRGGGNGMPWPSDRWECDALQEEVDAGHLEDRDGSVYLNTDWPDIAEAVEAGNRLQECLEALSTDARTWFIREYRVPPDLSQSAAFKELF